MIILGVGLSHCAGVSLIIDNELVFIQEEDRFSKRRRHKGWPGLSLEFLFKKFKLKENHIDVCAYSDIQTAKINDLNIKAKKHIMVHHHLAHVMSGWPLVDWKDFELLSIDGGGDFGSWQSIGNVKNRIITNWRSNCGTSIINSKLKVPFFKNFFKDNTFGSYWSVPAVQNFGMVDHYGIGGYEGKLMGLAGHGNPDNFDYEKYNYFPKFGFKKNGNFYFMTTYGSPKLGNKNFVILKDGKKIDIKTHRKFRKEGKILSEFDLNSDRDLQITADFAAYLQRITENKIENLINLNFKSKLPILLSGGTFGNVVLNGNLNTKHKIFVTPYMGDEGLSVGAAVWASYILGFKNVKLNSLYAGYNAGYNKIDSKKVAKLIHNEKVVGLIEGKMEIGPRALGARSILANPKDSNINYSINSRLGRVEYMPFAPVILEEFAHDVLENWSKDHISSQHMTLVYKIKPKWKKILAGVVHVDSTVRPQIINEKINKTYYNILKEYYELSKIPVLINTSFNVHGEPMVRTYEDGLKALNQGRIDVLVANNKIIEN